MDKSLKFWNEEKIQKNIFVSVFYVKHSAVCVTNNIFHIFQNDPHSNVIKLAVWTGSKSSTEIKACVIKRHVYKIVCTFFSHIFLTQVLIVRV